MMKEWKAALLMAAGGMLIGLLCAEMIVRVWFPERARLVRLNDFAEEENGKFARYDPLLGWDGKENAEDDFQWEDCRHHVRQNRFGYRGIEYAPQNKKGRRFVVLGDSVVWGFGVENDDIFTRIMEQKAVRNIEMVNMGVSGYGTDQEYLLWTEKGRSWAADEVILVVALPTDLWENTYSMRFDYPKPCFRMNDTGKLVLTNVPVPQRAQSWNEQGRNIALEGSGFVRFVLVRSAFAGLVVNAASKNDRMRAYLEAHKVIPARTDGYDHEFPLYYRNMDSQTFAAWRLFFAIVGRLNADVRKTGAQLTIVLAPSVVQVYPELWEKFVHKVGTEKRENLHPDAPSRRVALWAEKEKIKVVDLLPGLREAAKSNPDLYFPVNMHLTRAGHRIVADILLKELHINN